MTGPSCPSSFINLSRPTKTTSPINREAALPENVRRAVYWSLLGAPTAGVTYGGHGVWLGRRHETPRNHPTPAPPMAWQNALTMPPGQSEMGRKWVP